MKNSKPYTGGPLEPVDPKEQQRVTITIDKNGAHVAVEAVRGQPESPMPTNGAELVAYWEKKGVIGTRPGITDSVAYARALRRQAETRQH